MPRGKSWTKAESIALVEAFVHISEDEIVGINQRKETLFERIILEAKHRYGPSWQRGLLACKSRWQVVSREVSKFLAADLLVQSIERSGWNEQDYYNAAVKAYHSAKGKAISAEDDDAEAPDEQAVYFEFKDEWEILKHHQKWQATLSKAEKKRKISITSLDLSCNGDDISELDSTQRPIGSKKAKTILAIKDSADSLIEQIREQQVRNDQSREKVVADMMIQMKQSANDSIQSLKEIVSSSTEKITQAMRIKLLLDMDWSNMSASFRDNAQKLVEEYFGDTVLNNNGPNN